MSNKFIKSNNRKLKNGDFDILLHYHELVKVLYDMEEFSKNREVDKLFFHDENVYTDEAIDYFAEMSNNRQICVKSKNEKVGIMLLVLLHMIYFNVEENVKCNDITHTGLNWISRKYMENRVLHNNYGKVLDFITNDKFDYLKLINYTYDNYIKYSDFTIYNTEGKPLNDGNADELNIYNLFSIKIYTINDIDNLIKKAYFS